MRITLTEFVTLDGVCQGPGSPTEDTSDGFTRGGWLVPHLDERFVRRTVEWLGRADGLLLGRRTYEAFARDWPRITDPDDPYSRSTGAPGWGVRCWRPGSSTRCGSSWRQPLSGPGGGCSITPARPSAYAWPTTR